MITIKPTKITQNITCGSSSTITTPLLWIIGPCVIQPESADRTINIAIELLNTIPHTTKFIFKASFDKANRSSIKSYRGPGLHEGLKILETIKIRTGLPLTTDIHQPEQAEPTAAIVDLIQIPAMLSRQTDLITAAAKTGKAINIKKSQFMAPWEMVNVTQKIYTHNNYNILLTERGTAFGYNRLINDMKSIPIMQQTTGHPVIYDASHSTQTPAAHGTTSGGDTNYILPLTLAAIAAGCNGVFLEVHPDPATAPSDGNIALKPSELPNFITACERLYNNMPMIMP